MRTTHPIDALFPKTRQKILAATLMHPDRWWYLTELGTHLGLTPSSLQRELNQLTSAGILHTRKEANRLYYQPDPQCPFLLEITGLIKKTAGISDVLGDMLAKFRKQITWAFVYGSIARSEELSTSDVDLLVIGELTLSKLATPLRKAETKLAREINPVLYTQKEFAKLIRAGQHFALTVLASNKLFLLGDSGEFERAFKTRKTKNSSNK